MTTIQFKKYDKYKDSCIQWLGKIPGHWQIQPGFKLMHEANEKNTGMKRHRILSLSYGKIRLREEKELTGLVPESYETYQLVNKGDIIFRPTDLQNDHTSLRSGISTFDGIITSAYLNLRFKPHTHNEFYNYFFRAIDNNKVIYGLGSGLRQNIDFRDFKRFNFIFPPLAEQITITRFLDEKTARIDETIAKKEKMIALLNERKQIIIQNAVTKGLDPTVKMKDPGVEWIGQTPEQWKILPFTKYITEKSDYRGATPEKVASGRYLITAKNISIGFIDYECSAEYVTEIGYKRIMQRGLPQKNDLLFTTEAPLGHFALVDREDVCLAQRIIRFRMNTDYFNPAYTLYSVISPCFQTQLFLRATGSTALGIKASKLSELKLICPPIKEQNEVVTHLETISTKIDRAIKHHEKQIEKLKEYKAVLIDSAVTGKIKVI